MPKFSIEILNPAKNDIYQIAQYHLMAVDPKSASKMTDKLLDSIEELGDYPMIGATDYPKLFK